MAKKKQNNNMLYGLIAVAIVAMVMTSQGEVVTPQETQQEAQASGCTNTCASNYNQKVYPECTCYAATTQQQQEAAAPVAQDPAAPAQQQQAAAVEDLPCSDSDGGQDVNVLGTAREYNGDQVKLEFTDECGGGNMVNGGGWVKEYYCDNNHIESTNIQCTGVAGCGDELSAGVCEPLTCFDVCYWQDGGNGMYQSGSEVTEQECNDFATAGIIQDELYVFQPMAGMDGCCCYNDA